MVRSKQNSKAQPARRTPRRTRGSTGNKGGIPNVYNEMLAEVAASSSDDFIPSPRPLKRRKISEEPSQKVGGVPNPSSEPAASIRSISEDREPQRSQQVVYDDFEGTDESDVEFEDVDLGLTEDDPTAPEEEVPERKPLQIDLSRASVVTPKRAVQRRKPITKAEREFRLDVHKWHLMSLLIHGLERSTWCDREDIHVLLKKLIPRNITRLLHEDESKPMYQRNHSFMKGVEEVCAIWRSRWMINARGLQRAYWKDGVDAQREFDDAEDPVDFDDFKEASQTHQGSRDLGAQVFCALLRSLALEARLVFSLQVLSFSGMARGQTPEKPRSNYIDAPEQTFGNPSSVRRTGKKKIRESPFPVFWVEVLNPATTTWIPLDPLVRNTINKPKTGFEPPAADLLNSMTYVLAFEDDRSVHDVTRRYTQWFNAKTRKQRVESTKMGKDWWKAVLKVFRRHYLLPRDQLEDEQLARRHAAEGMPKNVVDFKDHPIYVLERHLRLNEVIHPLREVGKFSAGLGKNSKMESVYRREDVHACRTADAWYRRGRDVKIGEQPLKRAVPKRRRDVRGPSVLDEDDMDEEDREGVALYAEYQTQVYEPPPVAEGRIPKNAYGNLDVYVTSMIPAGAVHISHPMAAQGAKILGIDYADAVTGFQFKGRQGTAVVDGVVVALEYTAALTAVIKGLEEQGTLEVQAARSKIILALWKRMLAALRVRQKIEEEYGEGARRQGDSHDDDSDEDGDSTYADDEVKESGGGFMLDAEENKEKTEEQAVDLQAMKSNLPTILPDEVVQKPIKITSSPHVLPLKKSDSLSRLSSRPKTKVEASDRDDDLFGDDNDTSHGKMADPDGDTGGGGFMVEDDEPDTFPSDTKPENRADEDMTGGGFFADENDDDARNTNTTFEKADDGGQGGGFLPESPESENPDKKQSLTTANAQHHDTKLDDDRDDNENDNSDDDRALQEGGSAHSPVSSTSLISHDPEEDEMEPDWLDDALQSD